MSQGREIRTLLFELLKQNLPVQCMEATVKSVDKERRTCLLVPNDGGPELFDARLTAIVDNQESYMAMYPEPGSIVLATVINNDPKDVYVLAISEIESLEIKIGESTVKSSAEGHIFNGGSLGGMTITPTLRAELDKTNAVVKSLLDVINGPQLTTLPVGYPDPVQVAMKSAVMGKEIGDFSSIENEKVKH